MLAWVVISGVAWEQMSYDGLMLGWVVTSGFMGGLLAWVVISGVAWEQMSYDGLMLGCVVTSGFMGGGYVGLGCHLWGCLGTDEL